jgi:hypothetical protein
MSAKNKLVVGVTAAGVAGSGFVALRLFIREKVREALVVEYDYPSLKREADKYAGLAGLNLNLPPADAFAEALVPLWSLATPYAAIEDVLAKGRKSPYWPDGYRKTPKGGERVERAIFEALEAAYKTPEGTSNKDMGLVALNAFTTDLFAR